MSNLKNILITGGSGFLGGYLVKAAQENFNVYATYWQNLPDFPEINWIKLDLSEFDKIQKVLEEINPDLIIHNAALTNVDFCEKNKEITKIVNIKASEELARVSKIINARIFYISTDLVFDGDDPPYSENAQPNPISFYGWSKWQAELVIVANNLNHVVIRPAIMYGPPAILGTSFSEWMRYSWINKKITNLFTDQCRTPIFAANLAEAVLELSQIDYRGIIHFAGSERINRFYFGNHLADQLSLTKNFIHATTMAEIRLPGKRPADVSLKIDKAQNILKTKFLDCREGIQNAYRGSNYQNEGNLRR